MAGLQANQPSDADADADADEYEAWVNWVYPPEFYDRLSKIHLTREALAELDRRNRLVQHRSEHHQPHETTPVLLHTMPGQDDLSRFARHGGPDLRDIYNYQPPKSHRAGDIGKDEPSLSKATMTTDETTRRSTPYNADFQQHLEDHNVQRFGSKPANLDEIRATLNRRRPSLTLSQFSEGTFDRFQNNNLNANDEVDVICDAIPVMQGKDAHPVNRQEWRRNTVFNNLAPLTDATIARPKPGIYYGARPKELSRSVRDAIGSHIVPSTTRNGPLAPNFFVEAKGPAGTGGVAARQVRYDGAVGARAIHSLQNYGAGAEQVQYDGRAYTYSSSFLDGNLKLYAHHATAPTSKGGQPQYHMTQLGGFDMTNNRETFVQGATAFRNARDLAKQHRDRFIQSANEAEKRRRSLSSLGVSSCPMRAAKRSRHASYS